MDCPSNTPLVRKLGIKAGHRLAFVDAPAGFARALSPLPPGALLDPVDAPPDGEPGFDVIVWFAADRAALAARLGELAPLLRPAGGLWICWPKKSSGVVTDLSDGAVRAAGLGVGLVDNKVCSIDATWSGLRFVIRLADRPRR
jgi:hypothetical protein